MANDLKEHNKWEIPPIPPSLIVEEDDDDDDKLIEAGDDEGNDEEHDREVEVLEMILYRLMKLFQKLLLMLIHFIKMR